MLGIDKYLKIDVAAGSVNLQLPMHKGFDLDLMAAKIKRKNESEWKAK